MRKFIIIFAVLTVLFSIIQLSIPQNSTSENKVVHFSIDDVENLFYDLVENETEYNSIFDNYFLATLRNYHNEYSAKFTLYTYEWTDRYSITDIPTKFRNEFHKNSEWLRIGFHWIEPKFNQNTPAKEICESFIAVNRAINHFASESAIAHTLRLHYFYGNDSILTFINNMGGVNSLLGADQPNRKSYNLTITESDSLYRYHYVRTNTIQYFSTDIRLERYWNILLRLNQLRNRDTLVIFTHEWALSEQSLKELSSKIIREHTIQPNCLTRLNMDATIKWLHENGYQHTFLE